MTKAEAQKKAHEAIWTLLRTADSLPMELVEEAHAALDRAVEEKADKIGRDLTAAYERLIARERSEHAKALASARESALREVRQAQVEQGENTYIVDMKLETLRLDRALDEADALLQEKPGPPVRS